jgi:hypothetical protein
MRDQELVEFWSLKMKAMARDFCLTTKNKNSDAYLPLSFHEKVKDINLGNGSKIMLYCVTTRTEWDKKHQYNFTLTFDLAVIPFNISPLLDSLQTTEFSECIKELEEQYDNKFFEGTNGQPLCRAKLCSKIRKLIENFDVLQLKLDMQKKTMTPISVSLKNWSQGASAGSMGTNLTRIQESRGKRKPNTPLTPSLHHGKTISTPPRRGSNL